MNFQARTQNKTHFFCGKEALELPPGTLSSIASYMNVPRTGIQHQAGSDSLVTSRIFFKLREEYLHQYIGPEYHNVLHGLSSGSEPYANEYDVLASPLGHGMLSSPPGYYYPDPEGYDAGYSGAHPYYAGVPESHQPYSSEYYTGDGALEYM